MPPTKPASNIVPGVSISSTSSNVVHSRGVDHRNQAQSATRRRESTVAEIAGPSTAGPVNDGERRMIKLFESELGDKFTIIPNIELSLDRGTSLAECDMVIVGPDCVWVVEVKDLAGVVDVSEHNFVVNGEQRSHPVMTTRRKAQKISSRLRRNPQLKGVWVQPLVVLAREPKSLTIAPTQKARVMLARSAVATVSDPELIGLDTGRINGEQRDLILGDLLGVARTRPERERFGKWVATKRVSASNHNEWWLAHNHLFANERALLQVVRRYPTLSDSEWKQRKAAAMTAVAVRKAVGDHPNINTPDDAIEHSDGSIVIVNSERPDPSLSEVDFDDLRGDAEMVKRQIVRNVAAALSHCHANGVAHRFIGPDAVRVDLDVPQASLTGFTVAQVEDRDLTLGIRNWPSLGEFWQAPEHGRVDDVGAPADLWALGKLIESLWTTRPAELGELLAGLTAEDPADRHTTADDVVVALTPAAPVEEPTPQVEIAAGSVLADFTIERPLGHGNSGAVWTARENWSGKTVALKIFRENTPEEALKREYNILADINHDNVMQVMRPASVDGHLLLPSEFLEGPDLRTAMNSSAFARDDAMRVALTLLDVLKHIHPDVDQMESLLGDLDGPEDLSAEDAVKFHSLRAAGVIHGDIKPANIILVEDRGPVLVDFGVAAAMHEHSGGATDRYLPGDRRFGGPAVPDGDLFAVGVILHELLTGQHPYTDSSPYKGELAISGELPDGLAAVIRKAVAPKEADRFVSAAKFLNALVAAGIETPESSGLSAPSQLAAQWQSVQDAMSEQRWDDARELCDPTWTELQSQIDLAEQSYSNAASAEVLLSLGGVELTFQGSEPFAGTTSTDGSVFGPGVVHTYLVSGEPKILLQVDVFADGEGAQMVNCSETFESPDDISVALKGRMRFKSLEAEQALEIGLAAEGGRAKKGWSVKKANLAEISAVIGQDAEDLFREFGAVEVGTREALLGDQGRRRSQLCAVPGSDAEHLAAVLFVATRVVPVVEGTVR